MHTPPSSYDPSPLWFARLAHPKNTKGPRNVLRWKLHLHLRSYWLSVSIYRSVCVFWMKTVELIERFFFVCHQCLCVYVCLRWRVFEFVSLRTLFLLVYFCLIVFSFIFSIQIEDNFSFSGSGLEILLLLVQFIMP